MDTSSRQGRSAPTRAGRAGRSTRAGRATAAGESERRAAIVEIAAGLFAERGYRATTVREIADAAGMLSGSLYHHFDSKESIVDELLSSFLDELHAQYTAIAAARAGPSDTIAALARAAFAAIAGHRAAVTVFQNERGYLATLPRFAYLRTSEEASQALWLRALSEGIAGGELRADLDPKLTHRFLRDAIWVSVHWYRPDGPLGPDEMAEHFLATVFDGIRARGTGGDAPPAPAEVKTKR
ncbi:TetR family transcriptional regulator [Frankia sp. CNm7]|uniref:TetR family transcriptional regulator n=1 Tax=Frankia nepalensis TaxID=1836974 RepID=A0A937RW23_9ACTN|nr:TetR/AcrR family transcriptional regulator [Frankia nepalensis]MBL7494913.1 TetR family transcriptional regulator [Frankia nepalensis]MBL7514433.1 TetR family transcriptional regulator [Frankia nepalensis]MBL7524830.1 TetR family transcriptional regulator [Frankia nepalensis]MBL7632906.1 TetR family transcriptional regulator [Frankia nepalensis]